MKIYKELNLNEFEAWSGAVDTLNRLKTNKNWIDTVESYIDV